MELDFSSSLPDTESHISVPGLDGEVTILRDKYGIPHIRAQNNGDAFFGQGFATAQDRLWHMDFDRRQAYGRWSEFVGVGGVGTGAAGGGAAPRLRSAIFEKV